LKPKAVDQRNLKNVLDWWRGTMASRANDPKNFSRVIIMQRLAENDLAGEMLAEGYEHLCLPMRFVPNCTWDRGSSLGKLDPRTTPGELLFPERFTEEAVARRAKDFGTPANVAAQEQQNPTPAAGGIVEAAWCANRWEKLPHPRNWRICQSWDFGFKGSNAAHSRVSGTLWLEGEGRYYLLDEIIGHMNFPDSKRALLDAQHRIVRGTGERTLRWSDARVKLIEDKANGSAIIQELQQTIHGVQPVVPRDDKATRLIRHTDLFQSGSVLFPTSEVLPSVAEFIDEVVTFPRGRYDDRVDTTTQALDHLASPYRRLRESLEKLGSKK
jgi:predicted phage terminase large subunit-like protein